MSHVDDHISQQCVRITLNGLKQGLLHVVTAIVVTLISFELQHYGEI
jgi:hypothetical protein